MKSILKTSVVINVLLAGLVFWLLRPKHIDENSSLVSAAKIESVPRETHTEPVSPAKLLPASPTFRWNQLESTDYRTYVANLRRIECPEQTIHDIITADVDQAIFAPRRDQLRQQQFASTLENTLQQLNQEEAAFIATLLGDSIPSQIAANPPRIPRLRTESRAELDSRRTVSTPLIFASPDSAAMQLNPAQLRIIDELRQTFVDEIGGTNQNPNDPAYRQRWQAAQREADDMLAGLLGRNFVLKYQQAENPPEPTK